MHNSKRQKLLAGLLAFALLPFTILFLTLIVLAKEPETIPENIKAQSENKTISEIIKDGIDFTNNYLQVVEGKSSYYGNRFHNRKAASGEKYNMFEFTAAHRTLPFGTIVKVTNLQNNLSTFVRINDRGPFVRKRIIDLSYEAAKSISALGVDNIKMETVLIPRSYPMAEQSYYTGFSFDKPIICLPRIAMTIIDSTNDFTIAVKMLTERRNIYFADDLYIFAPVNPTSGKDKKREISYFLASIPGEEDSLRVSGYSFAQ
jgi:rare lipoprotein A